MSDISDVTPCNEDEEDGSMDHAPSTYKQRGGRADNAGEEYEYKMGALLFFRGVNNTDSFRMGINVDKGGAFDDLVFKYKMAETDFFKIIYTQLKHKQTKSLCSKIFTHHGKRSQFGMLKHYKSYCGLKARIRPDSEEDLFCGNFENCDFVLYTNAKAEGWLEKSHKELQESEVKHLLSTEGEKPLIFGFCEDKNKDIFKEIEKQVAADTDLNLQSPISTVKEFLGKIKIFSGQARESKLDALIETEVGQALGCSILTDKTKEIAKTMIERVKAWWKESEDDNVILTEKAQIWGDIVSSHMNSMNKSKTDELQALDLFYSENVIKSFWADISDSRVVAVNSAALQMLKLKVFQVLHCYCPRRYIFMNLQDMLTRQVEVLKLWQGPFHDVLALECSSSDHANPALAEAISRILTDKRLAKKRMIIISPPGHALLGELQKNLGNECKQTADAFTFDQLDTESQDKVMKKEIILQGMPVTLESLIGDQDINLFHDILIKFLSFEDKLIIGERLSQNNPTYIPRILMRNSYVHSFKTNLSKERIIVDNITLDDLQEFLPLLSSKNIGEIEDMKREKSIWYDGISQIDRKIRFLVASEFQAENGFQKICETFPRDQVHWLQYDEKRRLFVFKKSNVKEITEEIFDEDVGHCKERQTVLAAQPGMGKTTFINHLTCRVKENDPSLWVLSQDLNDQTEILDSFKKYQKRKKKEFTAFEFLSQVANVHHNPIGRDLLRFTLDHSGKMVLFIDGLDEVQADFKNVVFALLQAMLQTKVSQIWVTTRQCVCQSLEEYFSTLSYSLKPLTPEDQACLLRRLWQHELTSHDNPERCITDVMKLMKDSFNDNDNLFMEIPLQTKMVSEVLKRYISGGKKLPHKLDMLTLYDRFMKMKWVLWLKEKLKRDTTRSKNRSIKEYNCVFIPNHTNAALLLLFTNDEFAELGGDLEKMQAFLESVRCGDESTGVIDGIRGVGSYMKPVFVHRSYAEFLAGRLFAKRWKENNIQTFLRNKFFSEKFSLIRNIFDRELIVNVDDDSDDDGDDDVVEDKDEGEVEVIERRPLHLAVLNANLQRITELLPDGENVNAVCAVDAGGRTPLHLAMFHHRLDIIELLIRQGADLQTKDKLLNLTPFGYAARSRVPPLPLLSAALRKRLENRNPRCTEIESTYDLVIKRSDMTGAKFCFKMAALFFLRAINNTAAFHMGANVDGAGPFGELVLQFKQVETPANWKTLFMQLKYMKTDNITEGSFTSNRSDLYLRKNYVFFCNIKKAISFDSEQQLFQNRFENCEFIHFTNGAVVGTLAKNHKKIKLCGTEKDILLTSQRDRPMIMGFSEVINNYMFKAIQEQVSGCDSEQNEPKILEFLNKLKIFSGQAREAELTSLIECEIGEALGCSEDQYKVKSLAKTMMDEIMEWWGKSDVILTEEAAFWKKIVTSQVNDLNKSKVTNLLALSQLDDDSVSGMSGHLTINLQIFRALNCNCLEQFVFIDLQDVIRRRDEVLKAWSSPFYDVLAIDCCYTEGKLKDLADDIHQTLSDNVGKKMIILIAPPDHPLLKEMACKECTDIFVFKKLDRIVILGEQADTNDRVLDQLKAALKIRKDEHSRTKGTQYQPSTYKKAAIYADVDSELYEVRVASLLFLRGHLYTAGFSLASNVKQAARLGDIVFKYKVSEGDSTYRTCFVGLVHRRSKGISTEELLSDRQGQLMFSVKQYFKSYCEILTAMNAKDRNGIFDNELDNCEFVVYTNADPTDELLKKATKLTTSSPAHAIICTSKETDANVLGFSGSDDPIGLRENLMKKVSPEEKGKVDDFLSRFKLYYGQSRQVDLYPEILRELEHVVYTTGYDTEYFGEAYLDKMKAWRTDSNVVLNEWSRL